MQASQINKELCVSYQITIDDLDIIKENGFKTIICNRPDGEDINQTEYKLIENRAKELGLDFIFQPITGGTLNVASAMAFNENFEKSQKPVFAYCRTGTRCTTLWAISRRELGDNIEDITNICLNAGYNVSDALNFIK